MPAGDRETLVQTGLATTGARAPARAVLCKATAGPARGAQLLLGSRAVLAGADQECELVLEDPKVSRKHAELTVVQGGVQVKDLGSRNGVFLNEARVKEALVPLGGSVRLGGTTLKFAAAEAPRVKPSERNRFGGLVGESTPMREVFAVLELAAPTDATVLIQGESGSGKELAARALHDHSKRANKPFIVVDCSAASEQLIDSQLFGHKRGAFTGANADREGAFVAAKGGTVFLDELGELPLASQARLLRALEARTVQPLGSDRQVPIDVRVVAATHRDLSAMVAEKTFRFDLFHRLAVVHLALPPLRERAEDLPLLVRWFYEGRSADPGPIEGENLTVLTGQRWEGNVRELRNALERAWVLAGEGPKDFATLALWLAPSDTAPADVVSLSLPFKEAKERWVESFERRYLAALYARHGYNITRAAEHAQINRRHFRERLEALGLYRA